MNWKWILILVLLVLLVVFTAQNYEVVEVEFLFWSFKTSRAVMILMTLATGIIIGWITSYLKEHKKKDKDFSNTSGDHS